MKKFLLSILFAIFCLATSGQNKTINLVIDGSTIKPWISKQKNEYQGTYHFSNSDLESNLILVVKRNSISAKIQSGKLIKNKWIINYESIRHIKIVGNKFISDKTDGEFVSFKAKDKDKDLKGLMVYKPWSTWLHYATDKGYELGYLTGTENKIPK
jgi:hypothetical protein